MSGYQAISRCRICGNSHLEPVLDLGLQALTGVFPTSKHVPITSGPLQLVKCMGDKHCGLLQLAHSYDLDEMYGENYGYRSGLNASMVKHLHGKVEKILSELQLKEGDLVLDIGSNDSTTLQAYPKNGITLVGMDPTGQKFRHHYPEHVQLIPDFFSAHSFRQYFGERKARIITSFSMFYDLEAPLAFMQEVASTMADDGLWIFEQSYMPFMLKTNSYDTVCHEHLEFYSLKQIQWMAERSGLKLINVEFNDINGGSFSVTACKDSAPWVAKPAIKEAIEAEQKQDLHTLTPYLEFAERVKISRQALTEFVQCAHKQGKRIGGLGASTKGNVLLQYCGLTANDVFAIGEVNSEKFGCITPGSHIPIISEKELLKQQPDYLLVLPWHYRPFFINNPALSNCNLTFPLPNLEIIPSKH